MGKMLKQQNGMVEIEAIFVIVIWMNIIFFLLNMGVVVYQQMNVVVAANEAAANAAETFSVLQSDPFIAQVTLRDFKKRNPYRYWNTVTYENWIEEKARWYACFRVKGNEFSEDETGTLDGISTNYKKKNGYRVLEVSVTRQYSVFVLNPVEIFGFNPKYSVSAVGSAVCYDAIHDMNMVAFGKEVEDGLLGLSNVGSIWSGVIKIVGKIDSCLRGN